MQTRKQEYIPSEKTRELSVLLIKTVSEFTQSLEPEETMQLIDLFIAMISAPFSLLTPYLSSDLSVREEHQSELIELCEDVLDGLIKAQLQINASKKE